MLPPDRIRLFVTFADDRLKKFQYELARTTPEGRRSEILNSLLNAYSGMHGRCGGSDRTGARKSRSTSAGPLKMMMQSKGKEFLETLPEAEARARRSAISTKETLQDAIQGNQGRAD